EVQYSRKKNRKGCVFRFRAELANPRVVGQESNWAFRRGVIPDGKCCSTGMNKPNIILPISVEPSVPFLVLFIYIIWIMINDNEERGRKEKKKNSLRFSTNFVGFLIYFFYPSILFSNKI
ncbi:hypothetical protein Drorol1_Dr00020920, partial [Drosera rotundifolia]